MAKSPTSIKLDEKVKTIAEIIGTSHQMIYDRGLQAYALDGKIKNPHVLGIIKKRQERVIEELEIERMVLEELTKYINNHNGADEPGERTDPSQVCRYCHKPLIVDPRVGDPYCSCKGWIAHEE